jgi:hypothetical protein
MLEVGKNLATVLETLIISGAGATVAIVYMYSLMGKKDKKKGGK